MNLKLKATENTSEIEIAAKLADEIWHECFADILTQDQIDYMIENFQSKQAMERQMAEEGYLYYLLDVDGEYVGYTAIRADGDTLFLSKIYLLADFRGKGISSRVFDFLEDYCKNNKLKSIWLTVNKNNDRAVAVYKKRGFRITREQVTDIGDGFVMDDFIFEKTINA